MSTKLTARAAIAKVLSNGKAMKIPDIIKAAVPLTNLGGATPGQTIYSVLYSENKKSGSARQFVQQGKGEFKLNPNYKPAERATSGASKKASAKKSASKKATARKAASRKTTTARRRSSPRATA